MTFMSEFAIAYSIAKAKCYIYSAGLVCVEASCGWLFIQRVCGLVHGLEYCVADAEGHLIPLNCNNVIPGDVVVLQWWI